MTQDGILSARSTRITSYNVCYTKLLRATNIAETSLTIEGIAIVIDCGLERQARFDPGSGMNRLDTVFISRDSADQRRGRAGRLGPGKCYRLWTPAQQQRMTRNNFV